MSTTASTPQESDRRFSRRYGRDTPEFARIVNLSDAVFAIAMTLLVFNTLDAPRVPPDQLARALVDHLPQLLAFVLSFVLVANIWWQHHKFFSLLDYLEPGAIAVNMVVLGAVALVPFPTSLLGHALTARAAVLPFISVFIALAALFLLLLVRVHTTGAWSTPPPEGLYPWLLASWLLSIGAMLLALVVALRLPLAGLAILAVSGTAVGFGMGRQAPPAYRRWG